MSLLAFQRKRIRICPQDFVTYQVRGPKKKPRWSNLGNILGEQTEHSSSLCVHWVNCRARFFLSLSSKMVQNLSFSSIVSLITLPLLSAFFQGDLLICPFFVKARLALGSCGVYLGTKTRVKATSLRIWSR